jgi:hypothetical protein
LLIHTI